jgi:two-component system, NtrC family, response regulator AtoC
LQAIADSQLRQDLYFRLNVVRLDVPPLRERRDDIPVLAEHFLDKHSRELGRKPPRLTPATIDRLVNYSWPGNIRELENMMERAAVLSEGDRITPSQLPQDVTGPRMVRVAGVPLEEPTRESLVMESQVEGLEKSLIQEALRRTSDNKSAAARLLEISERSLWYKIRKYGI